VILPVGGPIYQSASAAIKDSGKNTVMLGVDRPRRGRPSVADQILVSVMKRIDTAVYTP
jgi:basic membrane protein A